MKKILLSLMLLVGITTHAATTNVVCATGTNAFLSRPVFISSIAVQNASGTTNVIQFFDSPGTRLTAGYVAYTNFTTTSVSITNVHTNSTSGITFTNIYDAVRVTQTSQPGATNRLPAITAILSVPPSSTITYAPANGIWCNFGLAATNLGALTATVTYSTIQ